MANRQYEQYSWVLINYLWYSYRNNIWRRYYRMCPSGYRSSVSLWLYRSKDIVCSLVTKLVLEKKDVLKGHLQGLLDNGSWILFFSKSTEVIVLRSLYRHAPAIFKLDSVVKATDGSAQYIIATDNSLCGCSWIYSPQTPLLLSPHCSGSSVFFRVMSMAVTPYAWVTFRTASIMLKTCAKVHLHTYKLTLHPAVW